MNQSIIFPDQQQWHSETQTVHFPVQVNGVNLECVISVSKLNALSELTGQSEFKSDAYCAKQALAQFAALRFDIEELAEAAIEAELETEQGQVLLG